MRRRGHRLAMVGASGDADTSVLLRISPSNSTSKVWPRVGRFNDDFGRVIAVVRIRVYLQPTGDLLMLVNLLEIGPQELVCAGTVRRAELVDKGGLGLYIEVRAS